MTIAVDLGRKATKNKQNNIKTVYCNCSKGISIRKIL